MSLSEPRFFAYVYFHLRGSDDDPERDKKPEEAVSTFFEAWVTGLHLKEADVYDTGHPILKMDRRAERDDSVLCCLHLNDVAIVHIEQRPTEPEEWPGRFRERVELDFVKRAGSLSSYPCLGYTLVFAARSDESSIDVARQGVEPSRRNTDSVPAVAEISSVGNLYETGKDRFLLLSPTQIGDTDCRLLSFLNADFPIMESFRHKLEFEEKQMKAIRSQNARLERELREAMSEVRNLKRIERDLTTIKRSASTLRRNLMELSKLETSLGINLINHRNYLRKLFAPEKRSGDAIFTPMLTRFAHVRNQLKLDLAYARLTMGGMENLLKTLEIEIQARRLKVEKSKERVFAAIGVALAIGGATTNMPVSTWQFRLMLMSAGALGVFGMYFIYWWLYDRHSSGEW